MSDSVLADHAWTNRLVILITDKEKNNLEKQVRRFFEKNECDIDVRKLKLIHFSAENSIADKLPKKMHSQTGVWLVGYDSLIKAFSKDDQILNELFAIVDMMPIRKEEIKSGLTCD